MATLLAKNTSLCALPDELVLEIARHIPNIQNFALTKKALFLISTDVLLQRAETRSSLVRVCQAIRGMSLWTGVRELIDKLLTRVHAQVIQAFNTGNWHRGTWTLKVIQQLPSDTRISDDYFFSVVEAGYAYVTQTTVLSEISVTPDIFPHTHIPVWPTGACI
jgi:hypothetical protein